MDIANARQFHVPSEWLTEEAVTIPVGDLYRQLTQVLRLHTGDAIRLFDGVGGVAEGTIGHINRDGIVVPLQNRFQQERGPELTLAIAMLKQDRMRMVLEKATELGVTRLIPLLTERVIKRPDQVPPRWHTIIREAAEQSGHAWLPTLSPVRTLVQALNEAAYPIFYAIQADEPDAPAPRLTNPTLFIGPEGGWTEDELALAKHHGAHLASLGSYQLRADTAAIVALAHHTR